MVAMPSSLSASGISISRLAPMPLKISSGTWTGSPGQTATRNRCPPTSTKRTVAERWGTRLTPECDGFGNEALPGASGSFEHVRTRGLAERRVLCTTQRQRRVDQFTGAHGGPGDAVVPPTSRVLGRTFEPALPRHWLGVVGEEARLRVARRVDDR